MLPWRDEDPIEVSIQHASVSVMAATATWKLEARVCDLSWAHLCTETIAVVLDVLKKLSFSSKTW